MAYKNNGTANFNFFLNRQGPRGPQGIQGPQGFSPIVSVEEDIGNTFTLRVTNQDSSFVTSNLREHKEDRGGDYVRYDREGQLMYFGDPDFATTLKAGEVRLSTVDDLTNASEEVALTPKVYKDDITTRVQEINQRIDTTNADVTQVDNKVTALDNSTVKLTGNQTIEGTKTFSSKIRTKGVELSGNNIIQMDAGNISIGGAQTNRIDLVSNTTATLNSKNILTEGNIPSSTTQPLKMENNYLTVQVDNQTIQVQDGKLHANLDELGNEVNAIAGDVAALQADLLGKQGKLTAGENITITEDNVISSSASVPENVVTTDGSQSITGNKTFRRVIINSTGGRLLTNNIYDADNVLILKKYLDGISIGNSTHKDSILNTQGGYKLKLYNDQGTASDKGYILAQDTVTAGDNVTITKTTEGIQISATGGGAGSGDVTLAGDNSFTGNNTFAGETTFNAHTWTSEQEAVTLNVTSNATLQNAYVTGTLSSLGEITAVSIQAAGIKNNQNNKYYLNQASITAGDNITVEETAEGVKISSTGGGTSTGDVTLAGDNVFTGNNTFKKSTTIEDTLTVYGSSVSNVPDITISKASASSGILDYGKVALTIRGTSSTGVVNNGLGIDNTQVTLYHPLRADYDLDPDKPYYLNQNSITAGSDNIVISKEGSGIKITCNAPTNEQIGQILKSIADLSTKIDNLTNRVTALEETIDGGIA